MKVEVDTKSQRLQYGEFTVHLLRGVGPERKKCEQELLEAGVPVPLPHRLAWARLAYSDASWYLCVRDRAGMCHCGVGVELNRSRALPGHVLLRVERFGATLTSAAREAALHALAQLARRHPHVLRLNLEVFSRDGPEREAIGRYAENLGFSRRENPRCYQRTVIVDLIPAEADILASFSATCRQNIRAIEKHPLQVQQIQDTAYADRMNTLLREAFSRTQGRCEYQDWSELIEFSNREPTLSRLVGLFRTDCVGPEALVAFAWGCAHGDHGQYNAAASTRPRDLRVSMSYALAWDLISWAKRCGARWFDFGGVTLGKTGDSKDKLGGISDFKRFFSKEIAAVGEEWILEPHSMRALLANVVGGGAAWFSGLKLRLENLVLWRGARYG